MDSKPKRQCPRRACKLPDKVEPFRKAPKKTAFKKPLPAGDQGQPETRRKVFEPKRAPIYLQEVALPVHEQLEVDYFEIPDDSDSEDRKGLKRSVKRKAKVGRGQRKKAKVSEIKKFSSCLGSDQEEQAKARTDKNLTDLKPAGFTSPPSSKAFSFRGLCEGNISTPRFAETVKGGFKSLCFGFDDIDEEDELSPVKNFGSPKYFETPHHAKPQRFNLNLSASSYGQEKSLWQTRIQTIEKISANLNVEKVDVGVLEAGHSKNDDSIIQLKAKEDENIEDILPTVEENIKNSNNGNVVNKADKKKGEKRSKKQQLLISKFLLDVATLNNDKTQRPRDDAGAKLPVRKEKITKTYQRKKHSDVHQPAQPEEDMVDEDPEASSWKEQQSSHFSEIDETQLEFI